MQSRTDDLAARSAIVDPRTEMHIRILIDDVYEDIFRYLSDEDRFARVALVSKDMHRLAFACALPSFSFATLPSLCTKYEKLLENIGEYECKVRVEKKAQFRYEDMKERVDELVEAFLEDSYFLSRIHRPSIAALTLPIAGISYPLLSIFSNIFSGVVSLTIPELRETEAAAFDENLGDEFTPGEEYYAGLSLLSKLRHLTILKLKTNKLNSHFQNLESLEIREVQGAVENHCGRIKHNIQCATSLSSLTVAVVFPLNSLQNLLELNLTTPKDILSMEKCNLKHLRRLSLVVPNYALFPSLNHLKDSLLDFRISETRNTAFATIGKNKVSELRLRKLYFLGNNASNSLTNFTSQVGLEKLVMNVSGLDDHFFKLFFAAFNQFVNLKSLTVSGWLPIANGLAEAVSVFPKLEKFNYSDGRCLPFRTMKAQTLHLLIRHLPRELKELKIATEVHAVTPDVLSVLSELDALRLLRVNCGKPIDSIGVHWVIALKNLQSLRTLELSQPIQGPRFDSTQVFQICSNLPQLRELRLGNSASPMDRHTFVAQFASLQIFSFEPSTPPRYVVEQFIRPEL